MKNNELVTNLLIGLLGLIILATSGLAYLHVRSVQKLNYLQLRTAVMNRNRVLVNSLANEVMEYSKRNPAIDPLLHSVGIKPAPGASAASQPPKSTK